LKTSGRSALARCAAPSISTCRPGSASISSGATEGVGDLADRDRAVGHRRPAVARQVDAEHAELRERRELRLPHPDRRAERPEEDERWSFTLDDVVQLHAYDSSSLSAAELMQ
jgi:hypothetical protein